MITYTVTHTHESTLPHICAYRVLSHGKDYRPLVQLRTLGAILDKIGNNDQLMFEDFYSS